jgi:hypothetical protein
MAYFANGSEGCQLDIQCGECRLPDDSPCPILFVQMTYNYDQVRYGQEKLRDAMDILISDGGECQMKPLIDGLPDKRIV